VNFIQEYVNITRPEIPAFLSAWLPVFVYEICLEGRICKLGMLLLQAIESYLHTDGDLSVLHAGEFMCVGGLWFCVRFCALVALY
jgi:hypothetical protein